MSYVLLYNRKLNALWTSNNTEYQSYIFDKHFSDNDIDRQLQIGQENNDNEISLLQTQTE